LFFTLEMLKEKKNKSRIENFLKVADFGIEGLELKDTELPVNDVQAQMKSNISLNMKPISVKKIPLQTKHSLFKGLKKTDEIFLDFNIHESSGTQKAFALSGPVFNTLFKGGIIIIDEFDASLHFLITKTIIDFFHSRNKNSSNAQLIFATHDTRFLSNKIFRRDQIWFTEKNKRGLSELFSLADFGVRNDSTFDKDYFLGKYGAIPFIRNSDLIWSKTENE
jgi:uncharacterized protein